MMINAVGVVNILTALTQRMHRQKYGQILHISTVAAIQPRSRNFTYGAGKSSADFFARGLASKYRKTGLRVSVLRPGYVHSKMTKNFKPAPFAINTEVVSLIAIAQLLKEKEIFYAPRILNFVMKIFTRLPKKLSHALSK
jgi:decaprenylphospho-beta-D-erythro-pentofuranosid-2-ulose 2-reductase